MRIIFFGTPDFVLPIPKALKEIGELVAVVTNPDRPVGRDQILTPTPVKSWAKENKIPVLTPEKLDENFLNILISQYPGIQVGILAAYGKIIPQEVIDLFPKGILVIHPSLLPKYRGASPIQAALVSGEESIGCSIILMDSKMDHGPILSQFELETNENSTAEDLFVQAFVKSAEILKTLLPDWVEGKIEPKEQDHSQATFTTLLKKEYGFIPFEALEAALEGQTTPESFNIPFVRNLTISHSSATLGKQDAAMRAGSPFAIHNFIRALSPWPGCWTLLRSSGASEGQAEKRLKLLKSHLEPSAIRHTPNRLIIDEVQLEGKKPESWKNFSKRLSTI